MALQRATAYLATAPLADGAFPTVVARDAALARERRTDRTPFGTTVVLGALQDLALPGLDGAFARALDYLAREMEPAGVWRYWPRSHEHFGLIPPDLDDTCCCAAALRAGGRPLPDHDRLLLANRRADGLFYTWLTLRAQPVRSWAYWRLALAELRRLPVLLGFWKMTEAAPRDVDAVVNANALRYFGDRPETTAVAPYLRRVLDAREEATADRWYLSGPALYYAIAKAWAAGCASLAPLQAPVAERATAYATRADATPTDRALCLAAALRLGASPAALREPLGHLLAAQAPDGNWPAHALYWGGPERYYGWGGPALTTALAAESLALARKG